MLRLSHSRCLCLIPLAVAACWVSSCATALGSGYTIDNQQIHVRFEAAPEPAIHVDAVYKLRNTGNQPLISIEMRLPGRNTFGVEKAEADWDGASLSPEASPFNPRNVLLTFHQRWKISERHTLHLSSDFKSHAAGAGLRFTSDAFFLPSQGWAPELLPTRGIFATGGVPPQKWQLTVGVPDGFLVHTSGNAGKPARKGGELSVESVQTSGDPYPFVVAGRYKESSLGEDPKVVLWSRADVAPASVQSSIAAVDRVVRAFDQTFGSRAKNGSAIRIVECPAVPGCFSSENSVYAEFLGAKPGVQSAELVSADTLMVDLSGGAPQLGTAAPALAASWLGYGRNPGFYDQQAPLSAFPAFAASIGREAVSGPSARSEAIAHALQEIPKAAPARQPEDDRVVRAKSFLFFYALEERYGDDIFRRAVEHMLTARRGGGFNLSDLISAFEQESHQNVAEFVRLWMKRPGVPEEFRTHHESSAAALAIFKENSP